MAASLPIVIAGAGPAGSVAALYLARKGVPVVLLEAGLDLPVDLRASTFHPPTLDLLDQLDLTPALIQRGILAPTYQYRDRRSGEIAEFRLELLAGETNHPYRLQCEQFKLTRLVRDLLKDEPAATQLFGHRVIDVQQSADVVSVTVETPDGFRKIAGSFLMGADGASSIVRRIVDIPFEGFTYPEKFLVVSTPEDLAQKFDRLSGVNYVSDPDEWCVVLRTVDLWRVLFPTDPEDSDDKLLSDAFIEDRLQHLAPKQGHYEIGHRTLYRVHQRVAQSYRRGRVALAGDAAHINNPLGGMGMNGGLHDAFNLAEKLLAAWQGADHEPLLDRYERQRRTIALEFVHQHTIRNKALMEAKDPKVQAERQAEFMRTAADPALAKTFLMRNSMIDALRQSEAIQ